MLMIDFCSGLAMMEVPSWCQSMRSVHPKKTLEFGAKSEIHAGGQTDRTAGDTMLMSNSGDHSSSLVSYAPKYVDPSV